MARRSRTAAKGTTTEPLLRVLYIEDVLADMELTVRELEKAGFQVSVDVVQTREAFAEKVHTNGYDVVLADYKLPQWKGIEGLEILRQAGKDIPFILVTGTLGDDLAVECIKQGAADYVLKDRLARLPSAVRRALEEKALRAERQQAQRKLAERTTYLTALIEHSPLAIVVLDPDQRVETVNPAFEALFQFSRVELEGQKLDDFVAPLEFLPEVKSFAERVLAGETVQGTTRRLRKDGTVVEVEFHGVPLRVNGCLLGVYAIYQDITERVRAEQERLRGLQLQAENEALAEADRLKSAFLADMSHEFRTPLNSILGFSELLLQRADSLPAEEREDLSLIHEQAQHLLALVNDLLDLNRIEAGHLQLEPSTLSVQDTLLRMVDMFSPQLQDANLKACVEVEPPDLAVYADARRLEQILTNLMGNAVKFTPQGNITLRAGLSRSGVLFSVEDTGVGIPREKLSRVFDKFFQAHQEAEGATRGTGLGLAITRQLVELHGGRIWAESKPGQGTRFYFTLPNAPTPAVSLSQEERLGDTSHSPRG